MKERRRGPRYRCQIRGELRRGGKSLPVLVRDVSRAGLSVQLDTDLAQGDEVDLAFGSGIRIRAIAWRSRRGRNGFVIGMMLSEVTPEYEALVERGERHAAPSAAPPRSSNGKSVPGLPPRPRESDAWWRLRVKESDGPRTRIVTLAAASRTIALEKAIAELGPGWEVIEAQLKSPVVPKGF